jgi:hypothetical protein
MGLDALSRINWLDYRILAVDEGEEPIVVKESMINLQSKELDTLADKVEKLAENVKTAQMGAIAASCWEYIKVRAEQDPIHISFRPYNPPLVKCNKVFKACYPESAARVAVECAGGQVLITEADEVILKKESAPFRNKTIDLVKMGITAKTFELLLAHLCGGKIDHRELDFTTLLDLMQAASLLQIKHLATEYVYTVDYSTRGMKFKTVGSAVFERIVDLKRHDSNCFENEVLLSSFQKVIQSLLDDKCNYHYLNICVQELPIRTFRFGRQFRSSGTVSFGPEMPDYAYQPIKGR